MTDGELFGTLASGGVYRFTTYYIRVEYPDSSREAVTVDLSQIVAVRRDGNEVVLRRRDGSIISLVGASLDDAGRLEAAVRSVVATAQQSDVAFYTQPDLNTADTSLERAIANYHRRGFHVVSRTASTAQMRKPKRFSCMVATLSLLVFGIGFLIYLFYYASKRDEIVYLSVDPKGQLTTNRGTPSGADVALERVMHLGDFSIPLVHEYCTIPPILSE